MNKIKVYDLPTRLFHWTFAGLFLTSFFIAKTVSDQELLYSYHMISGLILLFVSLLRLVWGLWGTPYAKFSHFDLNPKSLLKYFFGILKNSPQRWAGHNPASSWAALIMLFLAISLGVSGFLMALGLKMQLEDTHELMANSFIILVIGHVLGIAIHTVRHRDLIGLSMLNGNKFILPGKESETTNNAGVAIAFLVFLISFGFYLNSNFNPTYRELSLFGQTLSLGDPTE